MKLSRALALCGVLGFSFAAAGCGGQSGSTPPLQTQDSSVPAMSTAAPSDRSAMSTTAGLIGKVTYMTYFASSHEFQVKSTSGALVWVYTNSSTNWSYNGLTLKVGDWATVNGSYSSSSAYNATSVSLTATEPALATTTTTTSAPVAGIPKHVQTAEYLTSSVETQTSPSVYAPYLSWAYTLTGRLGITQSAGIKTVLYSTPVMPYYTNYEYTALNGTYAAAKAKTCTGATVTTWSAKGLLSDPTKSATASYLQNIVSHITQAAKSANPGYTKPWDLIYVDDAGPLYGSSGTPCNYNASTWGVAMDNDLATTSQKFILNALAVATPDISTYVSRLKGSAISGGEFEECFTSTTWTQEGDSQLQSVALLKSQGKPAGAGFWCYADNTTAAGYTVIPQRLFVYASFLLTYDPNYSVFQESFSTSPSTFHVFPETGFVPLSPVSTPTSLSNLRTSTGAYLRQYNSCYYRGSLIGRCEIIANNSTASVAVPNPWGLHHSMVLTGGGVLDGGAASFGGTAPTTMGPHTGLILTP